MLTSRIGRRFIALFTGCALLPLVVFAWLAASRTAYQLHQEQVSMLHNHAKTTGMGIAARLTQVAGDLALAREFLPRLLDDPDGPPATTLPRHVGERCAAVWLVGPGGSKLLSGDAVVEHEPFNKFEVAHLKAGRPVVRLLGQSDGIVMLLAVDPARPTEALLGARIRGKWFWEEDLFAAGSECAVYDSKWRPLYHTFSELPDVYPLVQAAGQQPSSGTIEWVDDGSPYLARYWRAFLRPQYAADMFIVHSRRQLTGMQDFSWWLTLTAVCTLLLVLFASLVQMRRTLGPIMLLRDATRDLAAGNLGARVSIKSRDEFGELGMAFNEMSSQLQENIRQRENTERELVSSRDAALAAARAKAEFVTNVSHELRTPMAEILGAAEILSNLDDNDAATRHEFASIALHGARRLARLVDDVLEIGATTSWSMELTRPATSLLDAVAMMPAEISARIRTEVPEDLPVVLGDPARLTEVWCRLLDNAAKFSAPGSPIELRARAVHEYVVVEVCDRGVGIARLDLERIFEPFCQVGRDQMTAKANGTGLGLTLAKNAIERHGGRIEVDSELGNGSIFRVFLPQHRATGLLPLDPGTAADPTAPGIEAPAIGR